MRGPHALRATEFYTNILQCTDVGLATQTTARLVILISFTQHRQMSSRLLAFGALLALVRVGFDKAISLRNPRFSRSSKIITSAPARSRGQITGEAVTAVAEGPLNVTLTSSRATAPARATLIPRDGKTLTTS